MCIHWLVIYRILLIITKSFIKYIYVYNIIKYNTIKEIINNNYVILICMADINNYINIIDRLSFNLSLTLPNVK